MTFTGNTWGSGAQTNVYDIAILSAAPPTAYLDIVAMSNANNGAVIEDQRVSPAVLSVVYVDASTSYASDLGGKYHPYSTISPAITRVVAGGKINVAAGTYDEDVNLTKSLSMLGAGAASTTIRGIIGGDGATVRINASNVTVAGFTITTSWEQHDRLEQMPASIRPVLQSRHEFHRDEPPRQHHHRQPYRNRHQQ